MSEKSHHLAPALLLVVWACGVAAEPQPPNRTGLRYYVDETASLTLPEVAQLPPEAWQRDQTPSLGFLKRPVWFFFQLGNDTPDARRYAIEIQASWIDSMQLTCRSRAGTRSFLTGDTHASSSGLIPHRFPVFALGLEAQSVADCYLLVRSRGAIYLPLAIYEASEFETTVPGDYVRHGLFLGILLTIALFCLSLFATTQDRLYLYFFLHLIASLYYFVVSNGFARQYAFPDGGFALNEAMLAAASLTVAWGFAFSRRFLNLSSISRIQDIATRALEYAGYVLAGLCLLPGLYEHTVRVLNIFLPITQIAFVIVGILATVRRAPLAWLYLLGWFSIFGGGVLEVLTSAGILPITAPGRHGNMLGLLGEALLFALALGIRVRNSSLDRIRLALKLNALDADLERARRIHASLLPQIPQPTDLFEIDVVYRPMAALGGDFYSVHQVGPRQILALAADVCGHGLPAALDSSLVRIAFRRAASLTRQPEQILNEMNDYLAPHVNYRFVAAVCALLDMERRLLTVSNAGFPYPILLGYAGTLQTMDIGGYLLGLQAGLRYETMEAILPEQGRLILYSDGLFESPELPDEPPPEELVAAAVQKHRVRSQHEFLLRLAAEFQGSSMNQADDITLLAIDYDLTAVPRQGNLELSP